MVFDSIVLTATFEGRTQSFTIDSATITNMTLNGTCIPAMANAGVVAASVLNVDFDFDNGNSHANMILTFGGFAPGAETTIQKWDTLAINLSYSGPLRGGSDVVLANAVSAGYPWFVSSHGYGYKCPGSVVAGQQGDSVRALFNDVLLQPFNVQGHTIQPPPQGTLDACAGQPAASTSDDNTKEIVIGVVGGLVGAAIIAVVIAVMVRRRRRSAWERLH